MEDPVVFKLSSSKKCVNNIKFISLKNKLIGIINKCYSSIKNETQEGYWEDLIQNWYEERDNLG